MRRMQDLLATAVASIHGLLRVTITAFALVFIAMFALGSISGGTQPGIGWGAIAGLAWLYGLWIARDQAD